MTAASTVASALVASFLLSPPAFAAGAVVDSTGRDVTVLKSFMTGFVIGTTRTAGTDIRLDPSRCPVVGTDGPYDVVDCDDELAARLGDAAPHMV